jgi:uncharacterized membrane protein
MLKLAVAVLSVVLAGAASAVGWRDLRVDGSSDEAFAKSLAAFNEKLSPTRRYVFGQALKDIWNQGKQAAKAEQREYTASEYYRQLDGLTYEEVVTATDPSGATAKERHADAGRSLAADTNSQGVWQNPSHATQEQRMRRAHRGLDSAEAVRTKSDQTRGTPNSR